MNREIHITDLIPFLKNSHVKLELTFLKCLLIDASKTELPHYNLDFCNYLGCKINKNNKKSSNIYQWLKGERTIPFKKLIKIVSLAKNYKWDDVEKNLISIKSGIKKGEIYPKFPFYLDEKFGCIIGHILGDGSISRTYEISFNNTNSDLLKEFINNMYLIFGIYPRIWIKRCSINFTEKHKWEKRIYDLDNIPKHYMASLFYPAICGKFLLGIYGNFAYSKYKKITKRIFNSNSEFKRSLIRSFYDDESSVNEKQKFIRIFQDNKKLLSDIKKILTDLNICSNEVRYYIKQNKKRYYFNISGYFILLDYFNKIGFTSKSKSINLIRLLNKISSKQHFRLRVGEMKNVIMQFLNTGPKDTMFLILQLRKKYTFMRLNEETVRKHLHNLQDKGKIVSQMQGHIYIWKIR